MSTVRLLLFVTGVYTQLQRVIFCVHLGIVSKPSHSFETAAVVTVLKHMTQPLGALCLPMLTSFDSRVRIRNRRIDDCDINSMSSYVVGCFFQVQDLLL